MKYQVGDKIRPIKGHEGACNNYRGSNAEYAIITDVIDNLYEYDIYAEGKVVGSCFQCFKDSNVEPVTTSTVTNSKPYMRKKYMLLKDTESLKKGAIFEEMCDDGTQDFTLITPEFARFPGLRYERARVIFTNNPKWFKEVTMLYVAKDQVEKVKKFIKKLV